MQKLLEYLNKNGKEKDRIAKGVAVQNQVDADIAAFIGSDNYNGKFKGRGFETLSDKEKAIALTELAESKNIQVTDEDYEKFIETADSDVKDTLVARASEMSYYELMQLKSGKTSEEVYSEIKASTDKENMINARYKTEAEFIGAEQVKDILMDEDHEAEREDFADTYAGKYDVMSAESKRKVKRKAKMKILTEEHSDVVASIKNNPELQTELEEQKKTNVYEFALDTYGEEIKNMKKDAKYKDNLAKFLATHQGATEKDFIISELERKQKGAKESFAQVREQTEEDFIIANAEETDENLAIDLEAESEEIVRQENKTRIAAGMGARVNLVATKLRNNSKTMAAARKKYAEEFQGDFDSLDKETQDAFLAEHFESKLSRTERDDINIAYIASLGIGKDAITKLTNAKGERYTSVEDFVQQTRESGGNIDEVLLEAGLIKDKVDAVNASDEEMSKVNTAVVAGLSDEQFKQTYRDLNLAGFCFD